MNDDVIIDGDDRNADDAPGGPNRRTAVIVGVGKSAGLEALVSAAKRKGGGRMA
jgi:hypothetical protein